MRFLFYTLLLVHSISFGQKSKIHLELIWNGNLVKLDNYGHEVKLIINDTLYSHFSNATYIEVPDSMSFMKKVQVEFITSKFVVLADIKGHFNPLYGSYDSLNPTLSFYYCSSLSLYNRKMISEIGSIGLDAPFPRFDLVAKFDPTRIPFNNHIRSYSYSFDSKKQKKWIAHGYKNMVECEGGLYLMKVNNDLNAYSIVIKPNYDIRHKNAYFRIKGIILQNYTHRDERYAIIVWQNLKDGSLFLSNIACEIKEIDKNHFAFKVSDNLQGIDLNLVLKVKWHSLKFNEHDTLEVNFKKPRFTKL